MSEHEPEQRSASPSEEGAHGTPLPLWKKGLLALAVVMAVAGAALGGFSGGGAAPAGDPDGSALTEGAAGGGGTGGVAPNSLVGSGGATLPGVPQGGSSDGTPGVGTGAEPDAGAMSTYSPFFLKGGLSFLLAFSVGYALRTFLRMTIVVLGVLTLVVVGLANLEWITIHWATIQGFWDNHAPDFSSQFQSFQAFLTGSLPAVGLGGTGLWAGFKQG